MLRIFGQVIKSVGGGLHHVLLLAASVLRNTSRHTIDDVCMAAKLRVRILRLRLRMVVSSPGAASINQLRKSF